MTAQQPKRSILGFGRGRTETGDQGRDQGGDRGRQQTPASAELAPPDPGAGANGTGPKPADAEAGAPALPGSASAPPGPAPGGSPQVTPTPAAAAEPVAAKVERRWLRGPDPGLDECPKGSKPAAALWRARKAIVELEARRTRITEEIANAGKDERVAYDAWERRERLDGDQEAIRARRRAGVGAAEIDALAALAKSKGLTVEQLIASMKDGAREGGT